MNLSHGNETTTTQGQVYKDAQSSINNKDTGNSEHPSVSGGIKVDTQWNIRQFFLKE